MPSGRAADAHRRRWPQVFVADLESPVADDADRHHLERVLRAGPGDPVAVADGRGGWRPCVLERRGALRPTGDIEHEEPATPPVTIAFALTKGQRPELAVQKLTELGVDRMVPFQAARSVVRWEGDRAGRHVARLRRVAREAAAQCRRAWLPVIEELAEFDHVAALPGATLAEPGGDGPTLSRPCVLVGPEGGWSDAERECEIPRTSLGAHVLRAETAGITAAALLCALRMGLVLGTSSTPPG